MIRACYGRCDSLTIFQCQVVENEARPQTDGSLELPPVEGTQRTTPASSRPTTRLCFAAWFACFFRLHVGTLRRKQTCQAVLRSLEKRSLELFFFTICALLVVPVLPCSFTILDIWSYCIVTSERTNVACGSGFQANMERAKTSG